MFIARAALARARAKEREDRGLHTGDARYVSPAAPVRSRLEEVVRSYDAAHPRPAVQIRHLEAARAAAMADVDHLHRVVRDRLVGAVSDRPERDGQAAPERTAGGPGGVVMGAAFSGR